MKIIFFKIQILPRSLLLALLLAPAINNLEIFFTVSMSFYEFLWMFTSIYEYLRVFMNIFYDYLRIHCILHDQSCLNYSCLPRSLVILIFSSVSINFNFFHSNMIVLPYVWVRWKQNFYNLDIQMSYTYFHDPTWSKRSMKYHIHEY